MNDKHLLGLNYFILSVFFLLKVYSELLTACPLMWISADAWQMDLPILFTSWLFLFKGGFCTCLIHLK